MAQSQDLRELVETLTRLRADVCAAASADLSKWRHQIQRPDYEKSATNLAHYLALRRRELRELQDELMALGLSSLGRCESRVLPNLDAILHALRALADAEVPHGAARTPLEEFFLGTRLLQEHTAALLGPIEKSRAVHIMVTMATEHAEDYDGVCALVEAGMRVARINFS